MTNIRTFGHLDDFLDHEMGWRRKEIINLKLLHDKVRDHEATMLRRAGIALLYAHWEGFVKSAGTAYVEFVARRGLRYRDLQPNFVALGMKGSLIQAQESSRGRVLTDIAKFFLDQLDERADLGWKNAVQTKANLSTERLRDILAVLGLDYAPFELREKPVIERLLDQRNRIAHGQYLDVDSNEYHRLHSEVITMLELFRDQIDNAVLLEQFRR